MKLSVSLEANLAITYTIAIKWKEKYNAVVHVVDCHYSLCLCDDREKMSLPKEKKN